MTDFLSPLPLTRHSVSSPPAASSAHQSLDQAIRNSLLQYFNDLGDSTPHAMYEMMLKVVEKPLLEVVLARADGNQSRAAQWLGLNRNTLRKKLMELDLI